MTPTELEACFEEEQIETVRLVVLDLHRVQRA